jgi:hypothetical protein
MTPPQLQIPVYHDPSIGTRGQGYNLGDILNMPVYWADWTPFESHHDLSVVASQLPDSVAGRYYNCRSWGAVTDDPLIPHRPRLLRAIDDYIDANPEITPALHLLEDDSVLCVHVRSGDYGAADPAFLRTIEQLSKQYAKIIVMSGVHCNGDPSYIEQNVARLKHTLDCIHALVPCAVFDFKHPDVHVCYMARARNLLVHMGGFSILGTLVFSGKQLYITPVFQPATNPKWRDLHIPHRLEMDATVKPGLVTNKPVLATNKPVLVTNNNSLVKNILVKHGLVTNNNSLVKNILGTNIKNILAKNILPYRAMCQTPMRMFMRK